MRQVSVEASFVEIYNEQTFDLLGKVRGRPLQVSALSTHLSVRP
jgi:hypothetical protein